MLEVGKLQETLFPGRLEIEGGVPKIPGEGLHQRRSGVLENVDMNEAGSGCRRLLPAERGTGFSVAGGHGG